MIAFLILIFLRMPVGFAFALVGFMGLVSLRGLQAAMSFLGSAPYPLVANYTLVSLPLFILMGQFAFQSGISRDLYDAAHKWIGRAPGGLALATNLACTAFAACTGSSLASAATMGTIALPEMRRFNYDMKLATGSIAAGGTLGILIPPSTIFIIYGLLTQQSIGRLFIAGILPGLMLSGLFLMWIFVACVRNPKLGPPGSSFSWKEKILSLKGVWGMLALFLLVIGGLYFGIFTPSEAGAMGAFGAFILALLRRKLSWTTFLSGLRDSLRVTCFVLTILIGAMIYSSFLVHAGLPAMFAEWVAGVALPPYIILAFILMIYLILGTAMDELAMILLTIPVFFPVVVNLGFDPILFGVLIVVMVEAAMISPPVGMTVFIIGGIAPDVPLFDIFWGALPFFVMMLIAIVILLAFPQISLFLPNLMKG